MNCFDLAIYFQRKEKWNNSYQDSQLSVNSNGRERRPSESVRSGQALKNQMNMNRPYRSIVKTIVLAMVLTVFAGLAYGNDDITTSINEALEYYKNGDFTEAVSSLNYAAQLIQQKKGGSLESFLPNPLEGWKAEDTTSQAAAGAGMFGGVSAERQYQKGESSVTVRVVTDSPMIQGMMMMFTNPAFAVSDGGKLEKIARQKAIVKYKASEKQGDIQIMVANRFLVSIEGRGVDKADLKKYAEAIDYKKLAALP